MFQVTVGANETVLIECPNPEAIEIPISESNELMNVAAVSNGGNPVKCEPGVFIKVEDANSAAAVVTTAGATPRAGAGAANVGEMDSETESESESGSDSDDSSMGDGDCNDGGSLDDPIGSAGATQAGKQ